MTGSASGWRKKLKGAGVALEKEEPRGRRKEREEEGDARLGWFLEIVRTKK